MGSGASKRMDSRAQLEEKEKKTLLKTLTGHTGGINCMDVAENLLLTGSDDRTARLWDLLTYECKVVLEGHGGYITCCRIWQGAFALTGSFDKTIRKWNTASGNCVLKLERHSGMINRLLLFGSFLFSSSYDSSVVCWDIRTGDASRIFRGHKKSVLPLAYIEGSDHDPGGCTDIENNKDSIITGSMDKTARMWSITSATSLRTFRGHKDAILCLVVDRENNMLFTGSKDNTIRKWNLLTGGGLKVFKGHDGSVLCLQLNHRLLYSASADTTARCWVAEFGDTTRKYVGHDHMISDMKVHQGIVFTASGDTTVRAFEGKAGTLKRTFKGHKYPVNCLVPHEDTLLSGSYDGTVKVWNIRTLLKDRFDSSSSTLTSSMRSSVTQQGNRYDDSVSESDVSIKNENRFSDRKIKRTTVELHNEINKNKRQTARKTRGGKIAPMRDTRNGNNNSNSRERINSGHHNNNLQDIPEDDDYYYWAESSNQSSLINLKNVTEDPTSPKASPASCSGRYAREVLSARSDNISELSLLQKNSNSRPSTKEFTKRELSDLLTKRPRTDSSNSSLYVSSTDLVEEEIKMSAFETLSNTSGYHTADDGSPTLLKESPNKGTGSSRASTANSVKENRQKISSASSRISRIPTSTKSGKRQTRRNEISDADNFSTMTSLEQIKQYETELLNLAGR